MEIRAAAASDQGMLTLMMTEAFNEDTRRYTDEEAGGPPGYNNGQLAEKLLTNQQYTTYVAYDRQRPVGFLTVAHLEPQLEEIRLFCIHPDVMGQGLGTQLWQLVAANYPASRWQVETPDYSIGNHCFYQEKCGFQFVGSVQYGEARAWKFERQPQKETQTKE